MQALVGSTKNRFAALLTTGALAMGLVAAPAASAHPHGQSGLVNVNVERVLNNNNVSVVVPINAAANVCGVSVAVLAQDLEGGPVDCDARGNQDVTVSSLQ